MNEENNIKLISGYDQTETKYQQELKWAKQQDKICEIQAKQIIQQMIPNVNEFGRAE